MYDIELLKKDDPNIKNCYIMDVDFLIFYKKLCTVSEDLSYKIEVTCPECKKTISKTISFSEDIKFRQIDEKIMEGCAIKLGNHQYETIVPTVNDFMKVFKVYLRYRKIQDLKMIKTIALIKDFESNSNQVEQDVLGAKHNDVTLLMALRELYYDRVEPIQLYCPECNKGKKQEERRSVAVSVESLIVDFFRELYINSPINESQILFKQIS
jgi:rubredoxin